MNSTPYIIITNGMVGSGKTGLINKVINYYKLSNSYEKYLIDDLIETNVFYKNGINKLINQECENKFELCDNLKNKINNKDNVLIQYFNNLYFDTRGKTENRHCGENNEQTCDNYLDIKLSNAISQSKNIVFESTGTYYLEWLIDFLKKSPTPYTIYYAFVILDYCENINRNKTRVMESIQKYITNPDENSAPRYPNTDIENFKKNENAMLNNLWNLIGKKLFHKTPSEILVVFDNTRYGINDPIYDSNIHNQTNVDILWRVITNIINIRECNAENQEKSDPNYDSDSDARSNSNSSANPDPNYESDSDARSNSNSSVKSDSDPDYSD